MVTKLFSRFRVILWRPFTKWNIVTFVTAWSCVIPVNFLLHWWHLVSPFFFDRWNMEKLKKFKISTKSETSGQSTASFGSCWTIFHCWRGILWNTTVSSSYKQFEPELKFSQILSKTYSCFGNGHFQWLLRKPFSDGGKTTKHQNTEV